MPDGLALDRDRDRRGGALGASVGRRGAAAAGGARSGHCDGNRGLLRPPHDDDQVTVRLSFTREGAVIGEPRIVYARSSGGAADDAGLAKSMMAAIRKCTPLHFSARLGSAIAGQVLDIRFIGRNRATIVAPP